MRLLGKLLVVLGILMLVTASMNASQAPNISYLIGTFLPGLVCLIIGLKLGQTKKSTPSVPTDSDNVETVMSELDPGKRSSHADEIRSESLKFSANLGVGCGVLLMFLGSAFTQVDKQGEFSTSLLIFGSLIFMAGWAWMTWGCVNYMIWKGYSGWFGLFGYLFLPGLIILFCFPNKRKRFLQMHRLKSLAEMESAPEVNSKPGYRFLLTLAPIGIVFILAVGALLIHRSGIDPDEWKEFTSPEVGFQVLMPGTPRLEQKIEETPAGKVELSKFIVVPKGKKELFMIVSVRFPKDLGKEFGGTEKLLQLARDDVLSASKGQIKSEKQIVSNGCSGLELEVLPSQGAVIKARVFATKNQFYQVMAHIPKIRLISEDVQKFLDSFKLSVKPTATLGVPRQLATDLNRGNFVAFFAAQFDRLQTKQDVP